jgi:hypothetical protein
MEGWKMSSTKIMFWVIVAWACIKDVITDDSYLELLAHLAVFMFVLLVWHLITKDENESR